MLRKTLLSVSFTVIGLGSVVREVGIRIEDIGAKGVRRYYEREHPSFKTNGELDAEMEAA